MPSTARSIAKQIIAERTAAANSCPLFFVEEIRVDPDTGKLKTTMKSCPPKTED
jgi:hypothetical protein